MKKIKLKTSFGFWRKLINAWTILFLLMIIIDLVYMNTYGEILDALSAIYISILAIYVSNKEFERWYDRHKESHPGEIFVLIWSILIFILFAFDFLLGNLYRLPSSVVSAYIAVLTILVITRKSKELYETRRRRKG